MPTPRATHTKLMPPAAETRRPTSSTRDSDPLDLVALWATGHELMASCGLATRKPAEVRFLGDAW